MTRALAFGAESTVDEIMRRYPATIRVFLDYQMRCVGCPIGCFHTVRDAAREHHADEQRFRDDLVAAATRKSA